MAKRSSTLVSLKPEDQHLALLPKPSHSLFWSSTLFSDVYLQNDVPVVHSNLWNGDDSEFQIFLEQFRNYCETFDGEKPASWSERTTIDRAIKPILRMLGWVSADKTTVDPWLEDESFVLEEADGKKTYKPDFVIVNSHKELKHIQTKKGQEKVDEAKHRPNSPGGAILTVEAKYWDRIEEYRQNKKEDVKRADKRDGGDASRILDFDDQCLKYMEILNNEYGILTDGKTWRLYNLRVSTQSYKPYFQFNLGHMIRHVNSSDFLKTGPDYDLFVEQIKYFYFLFRKKSLHSTDGAELFVDDLLNYSKKYVSRVEEDLKTRFVNAMTYACNGFQRAAKKKGKTLDLETIRNISESHIFNILFLKYCESRNILPIKQDPEGYRIISISNMLDKIADFDPEKEPDGLNYALLKQRFRDISYAPDDTKLYDRLLRLTTIVQDGNRDEFPGFVIRGFKSSVFSREEWDLAKQLKLTNQEMVRILFELGYARSDVQGRKYQQIPYSSFSPRQLGSIYESFLEFRLEKASTNLAYIKKQWVEANLASEKIQSLDVPKVEKGKLFFTPDNSERKASGSYYTPDCVVQFLVRQTLEPLTKGKSAKQISELRVCDPAMGSGHFLSASLNFLARKYMERLEDETHDDLGISLVKAKQLILHKCIYGVDLNARAVKLAKMSLWAESADPSAPLEELDDQIRCTNSLTDNGLWSKTWKFTSKGLDAVVGNPPYLGESGHKDIFRPIAESPLGRKYYQGKMDLLYFFFHLGIDVLKPDGRLGYITTNYFTTASGASNLRKAFRAETNLELLINLNEMKVFGEAAGQHNMITTLQKTEAPGVTKCFYTEEKSKVTSELLDEICAGLNKKTSLLEIPRAELYEGIDRKIVSNKSMGAGTKDSSVILNKIKAGTKSLVQLVDVNQGVVSGANTIGPKAIEKFKLKNVETGTGVFVLSKSELASLKLSPAENKEFIRPFFKNSDVAKFGSKAKPDLFLIYVTTDKEDIPASIKTHLARFKPLLASRREVQNGVRKWFHIQWPREAEIFEGEKIVLPYRCKLNNFGYNESVWFGATDLYFITRNSKKSDVNLKYVLGLLNSELYLYWLSLMGKRKGAMLELMQKPLSELPIVVGSELIQALIASDADKLSKKFSESVWSKMNQKIFDLYGLSKTERAEVSAFYEDAKAKALASQSESDEHQDDVA